MCGASVNVIVLTIASFPFAWMSSGSRGSLDKTF
jgi:hypothetical protein